MMTAKMPMTTATMPMALPLGRPYRGQCKYKGGRCPNERTIKYTGEPHTLCEAHRLHHNKIQCKSDTKMRQLKRLMAERQSKSMALPPRPRKTKPAATAPSTITATTAATTSLPSLDFSPEEMFIFMDMMGFVQSPCEKWEDTTVVSTDVLHLLTV
ncbi:hypothetical protein AC1031_016878 [Aphanomyces cochlioides]|nr:hypothetical protein AC1031_016878 [Aphanomyces cochlioides]